MRTRTRSVAILLYDEVEVLDFAGPFEVFSIASRVKGRFEPEEPALFDVFTVAASAGPVFARGRLQILPHFELGRHPKIDVLIVPGGVVTAELGKEPVLSWIKTHAATAELVASVCTGAFLLGKAGLLDGKRVTTHWEDMEDLRAFLPNSQVVAESRWIDEGRIVTSAGISAGIDMSLHLVARLASEDLAKRTARQMDYTWSSACDGSTP